MLDKLITWSLEHRFLILVLSVILAFTGVVSLLSLLIDAFPDTTPVQVQINTVAPSLSPVEMERQVTFVIEQVISGIPHLDEVRSISKFGLSQITATFEDGTDIYLARQLIAERLQEVELPQEIGHPQLGPVSTGLGEIFHYTLTGRGKTLRELTTMHDWVIKPRLRSIPGVAEVNTWGGEQKQYHVLIDPQKLMKYKLTADDVIESLQKNNLTVGGGNISNAGELHLVQGISLTTTINEIAQIVITARESIPIRVKDVASVTEGHEIRRGAVTANGEGEIVLGLVFMLIGENSNKTTWQIEKKISEINQVLPQGVKIETLYQRTELVDQVIDTVRENLLEGALLVIAILFIFLGNLRAGIIVAAAIPLSMLFAFNAMLRFGIAGSLMSLGAIDFGLIVDSSVVMIENNVRRLGEDTNRSALNIVRDASIEVRKPTMFGELIIMIVYLPILTLEGIEGKLFRPMALTVIFALLGSLVLSLTLMPVLASIFLPRKAEHRENFLIRFAKWLYRPLVRFAIRVWPIVVVTAIGLLAAGIGLFLQLGSEFVPRLSEMSLVINTVRLSGVSLDESIRYGTQIEKIILARYPDEVRDVWTRTGTAEVATDPMGLELSDVFITLTPRKMWKRASSQEELVRLMSAELAGLPGMRMIFTQPIEMRVNEMIAGIRSDLGIKIFGDDFAILEDKAEQIGTILKTIAGSADIYQEQITGQPVLEIRIKQDAVSRYGVPAENVLSIVEMIGTKKVSEIREGQKRFALVLRLAPQYRQNPETIRKILVPTATGQYIPLHHLADICEVEGPSTITREWQKRRVVVQCNIRGRDIGSFVAEAQQRIQNEIDFPPGYYVSYGGQFEHLQRARARLMLVVPMALLLILVLLYLSTNSIADALIIFTGAPFAALGGVVALWLREMPFTVSAGVGFVAVSGVAMLNGLIMVSTIQQLLSQRMPISEAIEKSALMRLRPILMTALVASLGFIPMAFNTGVGAEVQRPLATVVIGGVISDNILTLCVLPALYRMRL